MDIVTAVTSKAFKLSQCCVIAKLQMLIVTGRGAFGGRDEFVEFVRKLIIAFLFTNSGHLRTNPQLPLCPRSIFLSCP